MANTFVNPGFTDTGIIGGRTYLTPGAKDEITGLADLARGLISQPVNTPQQQLAGFTADQLAAFQMAREGIGAYEPYLKSAAELTDYATSGLKDVLGQTNILAGQIPGEVRPGQAALQRAATGVEEAAARGVSGADIAAERARASTAEAQRALQEASALGRETAMQGIAQLTGAGARFTPDQIGAFMSDYEDAAVQQALRDIARQGQLQQQEIGARAVEAGAFGGSRQAIAEQELNRNILEQQGRTAAQMRAAGYESAAQRAQQASEQALARQIQAAQLTGQLGQMGAGAAASAAEAGGRLGLNAEQLAQASALQGGQLGLTGAQAAGDLGLQSANLGLAGIQAGLGAQQQAAGINQGIAQLGGQYLGMGQAKQQMQLQDINTMLGIGQTQQRQAQAGLDVAYQNQFQQAMQPYQQLAYYSDILGGTPSGQMSTTTMPGPSTGSQLLGLAMAVPAIYQGFQGMAG